ncbi:MAG: cytochrome c oxidase assembly protein, partial [Methylobacter sp.]
MKEGVTQKNAKLVRILVFVVLGMFGFGYALVPLYDVLCDITGLNGKVESSAIKEVGYEVDKSREITVEFMTALNETTPMVFRSEVQKIKVHPGEYYTVNFYA